MLNGEQRIRLYIAVGVPESTAFAPQSRNEIEVCQPHSLRRGFFFIPIFPLVGLLLVLNRRAGLG
jgi:hypothetical protein